MKVVIIGAGTTAMIAADIIMESHNFELAGFLGTPAEEKTLLRSKVYQDVQFLGDHSILTKLKDGDISGFVVAIGDNQIREKVYYEALDASLIPINAVSQKAIINHNVTLGRGSIISPGVVLSHGVSIGNNTIIDPLVVVDVNSMVGDHCYLFPGTVICGACTLGKNVRLGAGAIIEPSIAIGKNQQVASGSIVRENLDNLYRTEE